MIPLADLARRFECWLDEALPTLTPSSSDDVHVDELWDDELSPQVQLDASIALFEWVASNLAARLRGKIVMLAIPLANSATLDTSPPDWSSLASQLSDTPPSIYVMNVSAFLQADPRQRYIAALKLQGLPETSFAAEVILPALRPLRLAVHVFFV